MNVDSILHTIAVILITVIIIKYHRIIYVILVTLPRDIRIGLKFARFNVQLRLWCYMDTTIAKIFENNVKKHPTKAAILFEDKSWTYQDLETFSNKVSNFFLSEGYSKGDIVGLYMENCPEYVGIWLGLAKIGVTTALINSNLVAEPLMHSITVAKAKALIYGGNYKKVIKDLDKSTISSLKLYQFNELNDEELLQGSVNVQEKIRYESEIPPLIEISKGTIRDKLLYIYTSGTTGLPKAAVITNLRYLFMQGGMGEMACLDPNSDILYDPLPLYHSAGGIVGLGQCLVNGTTIAMRRKFSASNFWGDCIRYRCTAAQYIGEICRYILAVHSKNDKEIGHHVRIIIGNGLRPQIWEQFVQRFKIKQVLEFYGATEGNSNLVNTEGKVGAVGFIPLLAGPFYPVRLIRCEESSGEPLRDSNGRCIKCKIGEPGLFVGKISRNPINEFHGYADKEATKKKILRDVFVKGDTYFNSGDTMVQDEFGYFYFKDRTGDTFRWKGENVSTTEIEAVVSNLVNFKDAVAYGVEIPGAEGRAGMVAIVDTDNSLDLDKLAKDLKTKLPSYSIPLFVRVAPEISKTSTFKLKKLDLQKEGFNFNSVKDKLYFYDAKKGTYVQLDEKIYEDIQSLKIRL